MKNKFILLSIWCIISFIGSMIGLAIITTINMPNSIKAFIILSIVFYDIILYKTYKTTCEKELLKG